MLYRRRTLQWRAESGLHRLRVVIADSPGARRIGLRDPVVRACVLVARSIHTIGMPDPIGIAWVDRAGFVVRATTVRPNRLVIGPTNCVVETGDATLLPPQGAHLEVLP